MLHKFSLINSPDKILTKWRWVGGEGGETRSYRESDQKRDQAKSKALEIYFRTFCPKSNTKKLQSTVLLAQLRWLALKWLILRQNETQRSYLGLPILPYWGFYPYSQSLYGRTRYAHADVITKFSGMNIGYQIILAMGLRWCPDSSC